MTYNKLMAKLRKNTFVIYVRNFVFGVEDSIVSTVGLLSGIASAGATSSVIFLTGTVLIFVEAFSMAVGSFLSEESAEEFESTKHKASHKSYFASIIMFFSYFLSGYIPLVPYIFFPKTEAFALSVIFSLIALCVLGIISAKLTGNRVLKKSVEMLLLGGIAIAVGVIVGNIANGIIVQK